MSDRGRESTIFDTFDNSNRNLLQDNNSTQNLQKLLFYAHKNNKVKFNEWLINRKLSKNYITGITNVLDNTLRLKFSNVLELRDELTKVKNRKYRALALRNLFNFFEEYEILDIDLVTRLKSKIKVTEKSNIDSYIPTKDEVEVFLERVKEYDNIGYLFVKILLESGLRVTEVQHFTSNLDENKFEINGNVVIYPLYYLRGTKSSYYLFMSKELYLEVLENISLINEYNIEKLKTWIKRNNLIPLKYTRKYNFTQLIKSGISFEVANFIQGRVSQNIGFNHYLAKKEIALKEYCKVISFIYK